jgi:hypothetical protein
MSFRLLDVLIRLRCRFLNVHILPQYIKTSIIDDQGVRKGLEEGKLTELDLIQFLGRILLPIEVGRKLGCILTAERYLNPAIAR